MSEPAEHTIYKYTDKNGQVVYTDVPPNLADAKVVGFTGNTVGRAQTRPPAGGSAGGGSSGGQSEATQKLNAERRLLTADVNAKGAVYHERLTAYGAAANKLNAHRGLLLSDLESSNAALEKLDKTQDRSGYVIAALAAVGAGILIVATAPVTVIAGGVLVVGTAVVGEVNDRLRPENEELNDHPEAHEVKADAKSALRAGEAYEGAHQAHKALEVLKEGGTRVAPLGKKIPIAGALVTLGTAYYNAGATVANQVGGDLNTIAGLEALDEKLKEFDPSFLERNWAGFDKDRLRGEIKDTIDAQEEYEEALRKLDEASAAYQEAYRLLNDTYVARKGS